VAWEDVPVFLVSAAAVAAFVMLPMLYRPASGPFFPRQSSDFLPPAKLEEAKAAAHAALEKNPDDLDALTGLAVAEFQEGPDHAMDCAVHGQRALDLGALDDRLFYYTAACYEVKGLNSFASEAFEKYLRHHPGDLDVRLRLGNLYYRMGDPQNAESQFRTVLAARPGDALVSFNLAVALRDRHQWQEGLDVLSPILARDNTLPAGGFRVMGDLYRGLKDPVKALEAYGRELERSPDDAELLASQAQTFEDAGRDDDALAAWKRTVDLNPKNKQAAARVRALSRKAKKK
jgi:tetratricopeptide (TPR) repeat protein